MKSSFVHVGLFHLALALTVLLISLSNVTALCEKETNEFRQQYQRKPLLPLATLEATAKMHNDLMATRKQVGHILPGEMRLGDRAEKNGFIYTVGENLCYDHFGMNCKIAIEMFKNSPGHRENMLRPEWNRMGCAQNGKYMTCVYGEFDETHDRLTKLMNEPSPPGSPVRPPAPLRKKPYQKVPNRRNWWPAPRPNGNKVQPVPQGGGTNNKPDIFARPVYNRPGAPNQQVGRRFGVSGGKQQAPGGNKKPWWKAW